MMAGGERDDRGWDGWMASPTQWTWVWVSFRSWWWTRKPGVLQSMGSQRVGHDWTELNWKMCSTSNQVWILFLHFTSHSTCMLLLYSCLTLCNPMDYKLPHSSVHGIILARILEEVAIPFSGGYSRPRNWIHISCIAGIFFTIWVVYIWWEIKRGSLIVDTNLHDNKLWNKKITNYINNLKCWINYFGGRNELSFNFFLL